jgi:hypothetical protein
VTGDRYTVLATDTRAGQHAWLGARHLAYEVPHPRRSQHRPGPTAQPILRPRAICSRNSCLSGSMEYAAVALIPRVSSTLQVLCVPTHTLSAYAPATGAAAVGKCVGPRRLAFDRPLLGVWPILLLSSNVEITGTRN